MLTCNSTRIIPKLCCIIKYFPSKHPHQNHSFSDQLSFLRFSHQNYSLRGMKGNFKFTHSQCLVLLSVLAVLFLESAVADPRTQLVSMTCSNVHEHNTTLFVPNFVAVMENISDQMRTQGFGLSVVGSGPDANYGLAQCYGDLSLLDCVLCYAEARSRLPQCYPYNGGRIYLDGCFMRAENYSFYQEYSGPGDSAVCGNVTQKSSTFKESARQAISRAVDNAPSNGGYARAEVLVTGTSNDSAYVLADCWRTLDARSCQACLQNASASILGCLPWSDGRALNTGCFMRYSDINFLNQRPGKPSNQGKPHLHFPSG